MAMARNGSTTGARIRQPSTPNACRSWPPAGAWTPPPSMPVCCPNTRASPANCSDRARTDLDMSLDVALFEYPKDLELKSGFKCGLRPLETADELAFHEFFLAVPTQERMFIKHRVIDPEV